MKKINPKSIFAILLIALFGGAGISQAATINAASCSQGDVQSAIDSATDGDTVSVPAGNCSWTSAACIQVGNPCTAVNLDKSVILQGAGIDTTTISDGTDSSWNRPALVVGSNIQNINPRITGFTFTGNGGSEATIYVTAGAIGIRIDNNKFTTLTGRGVETHYDSSGLIDHNTFFNVPNEHIDILGAERESWNRPFSEIFGTKDAFYIEDNNWLYDETFSQNGANTVDANGGGQFVYRYNVVNSWNNSQPIEAHGKCAQYAGTRRYEIYNNQFNITNPAYTAWNALRFRSGEGVIFNNAFTGKWGSGEIRLDEDRLSEEASASCPIYSPMTTQNCLGVDPDNPLTWEMGDRPCLDQIHNLFIWNNTVSDPPFNVNVTTAGAEAYIALDRDYFLRQPSIEEDGFDYEPYIYPHPLTVAPFGSVLCEEGIISYNCWCEGVKNSGFCCHGYHQSASCGDTIPPVAPSGLSVL